MKSKILTLLCLICLKFTSVLTTASQICTSEVCFRQAESILSNINLTVSPCDNFYEFACGNFNKDPQFNSHIPVIERIISQKRSKSDQKHVKLGKQFYQKCMNDQDSINKGVIDVVRSTGWPFSDNYIEDENFSLGPFIKHFQGLNFLDGFFFKIKMDQYVKNQSILNIRPKFYSLKLSNSTEIEDLSSKLEEIFEIGIEELKVVVTEVLEFNDQLDMAWESTGIDDKTAQKTIHELQHEIFQFLNWTEYLGDIFEGTFRVTDDIHVARPKILKQVNDLLYRTPIHVIKNFIALAFFGQYYTKKDEIYFSFDDIMEDMMDDKSSIWTRRSQKLDLANQTQSFKCIKYFSYALKPASSAIYGHEAFPKNLKNELDEMIQMIRTEIIENFKSTSWLDDHTASNAIKKLQNMRFISGYPQEFDDLKFFKNYYKNLNFDGKNFFEIRKSINLDRKQRFIKKYLNPSDEIHDLEHNNFQSTEVNAFNYSYKNKVGILAAFVNFMNFSTSLPVFWNYGAIGSVVGHEIFHGFDSNGRHLDLNGDRNNWWSKKSDQEFLSRSQCLIDQYGNYTEPVTGLNVNGTKTLGENIADNGGFIAAYKAYQTWLKLNKIDQTLPNLKFTLNQLFWISAAQPHCSKYDKEIAEYSIKCDFHSPSRFRVIGSFGNSMEFLNDFKCLEGSEMDRQDKCKVW